jgi:hypothetical protein
MLVRRLDGNAAADNVTTKLLELCRMFANGLFDGRRRLEIVKFNLQWDQHRLLLSDEYSPKLQAILATVEIHYLPLRIYKFLAEITRAYSLSRYVIVCSAV